MVALLVVMKVDEMVELKASLKVVVMAGNWAVEKVLMLAAR